MDVADDQKLTDALKLGFCAVVGVATQRFRGNIQAVIRIVYHRGKMSSSTLCGGKIVIFGM